jgi:hypothetical protein
VSDFGPDLIREHFGRIWPTHVQAFSELLIEARRHFDGDLDKLLILAVIGTRTVPLGSSSPITAEQFQAGHPMTRMSRAINIQSIADVTGIPRETVRRKVKAMIDRGWLQWIENGASIGLTANRQAAEDLRPVTDATIRYLTALIEVVSSVERS